MPAGNAHRLLKTMYDAFSNGIGAGVLNDPGASGTITATMYGQICPVVTAGAEARTLAQPNRAGILTTVVLDTDGGDLTLTVTGGYNEDGDTTITFDTAGNLAVFLSIKVGTTYRWELIKQSGTDASTETLDVESLSINGTAVTATAAELNYNDIAALGTGAASKARVEDANREIDGVGVIKSVDKLVTTGEVLALNGTPITVLPAVGSGVYAEFLGAYVLLDYNSAAYVDDAGEDLVFQNLSGGDEVSQSADGTLFDGTADALVWVGPKGGEAVTTTTLVDNGGFEVTIQSGEWITGDSPLKIRLYYREIRKAALTAIA